jgi:lysozyme family protein
MTIDEIINDIIKVEGGYVNDPSDAGGETCWGITVAVARKHGYMGDMKKLPKKTAYDIYYKSYVVEPGFDKIAEVDSDVAAELVDTGVNMGTAVAGKFLQQALNAFNDGGSKYPDLAVDGIVGKASVSALQAFLKQRGADGKVVLLRALNSLQGARYIMLAEMKPQNERFVFGWIKNRVVV